MAQRHKLRYNRPLSSPRGDGSCFSNFFCPPPSSRTVTLLERSQKVKKASVMRYHYVDVENSLYMIEEPLFRDLQPHAEETSLTGSSPETPLILPEISVSEFGILRDAYNAEKFGAPSTFQYPDLLMVGDLAKRYRIRRLMKWFVVQFERVVCPPHAKMPDDALEPCRDQQTEVFMLSAYLAVSYGRQRALEFLSHRWITRLHARTLPALPTILFVYGPGSNAHLLTPLLAHACYVYLADLSVEAHKLGMKAAELLRHDFKGRQATKRFSLPKKLYDQIRGGNFSLEKTWEKMSLHPPQGDQGASCRAHSRCVDMWIRRWDVMKLRFSFLPKMDVLRKLVLLLPALEGDVTLKHGMNIECRQSAINNLRQTRYRLSLHLHHHFDLD